MVAGVLRIQVGSMLMDFLNSFGAAAIALILFVITQGILKFIIEPIQEQKKLIGEVVHALVYYDNAYLDQTLAQGLNDEALQQQRESLREASNAIRDLAGRLQGSLWTIPYYDTLARLRRVPTYNGVVSAVSELRGWSNGLEGGDASGRAAQRRVAIAKKLGVAREVALEPLSATSTSDTTIDRDVIRQDDENAT